MKRLSRKRAKENRQYLKIRTAFFNTVHLQGSDLKIAVDKSTEQEKRVLEIMKENPMTPVMVWQIYERRYGRILLTSIRRAMTSMSRKRKDREPDLEKLEEMKEEIYGSPNHYWRIK